MQQACAGRFNSVLVGRLINTVMQGGKKSVAQRIVYGAFNALAEKVTDATPVDVLQRADHLHLRAAIAADYDANLGALWEHLHRNPELSTLEIKTAARMAEVCAARVKGWSLDYGARVLNIDHEMSGLTFDILSATMFSDELGGEARGFERALNQFLANGARIDPLDVLGAPPRVVHGHRRMAHECRTRPSAEYCDQ